LRINLKSRSADKKASPMLTEVDWPCVIAVVEPYLRKHFKNVLSLLGVLCDGGKG
jgi:hypothetical protein